MIEVLVLIAIAYAGARGVESLAGTTNRQYKNKAAEKTIVDLAKGGKAGKPLPGPTEKGGTFSNAAPRSSALGGKAAVPLAVAAETGATMWGAVLEGYRNRWPEIRTERRQQMAERAEKRKAERAKAEAEKKAAEAVAKAGPPPAHPPVPTEPPKAEAAGDKAAADPDEAPPVAVPEPRATEEDRIADAEKRVKTAEERARIAEQDAATSKVLAAQKEAREAKEREAEANERARAAEARTAEPAERPHLTVVPNPKNGADMASSPNTLIPEIRTLDGLLNALTLIRAMCEMRAEEATAVAADDLTLSNRLDEIDAELADLEVDDTTRSEIAELRESIHNQSKAAAQYGAAAKDAGDFATAAAQSAHKSHGGIAEAVQSAPIEKAAHGGYYNA